MKANKIQRSHHLAIAIAALVVLAAVVVGLVFGYGKVRGVCVEPCLVTDMNRQVTITAGKMVKADVIAEMLGLRVGANLADIDFTERQRNLLEKIPNLQAVQVVRQLPDRVVVTAEERTPIARLGIRGLKRETGRVVDSDAMTFIWQRGTKLLPIIREPQAPGTPSGVRVKGRSLAALRLVEACREPDLLELGLLEIDTSRPDFLLATLGNYSRLKIRWEGMDDAPTPAAHEDLMQRLRNLRDAIRSRVAPNAVIWNATLPNRIFADTQEKL